MQLFAQGGTYSFAVPDGVSHLQVEIWGAGGGGGGYFNPNGSGFSYAAGSGGGAGGYTRTIIPVTPATTYNVVVGAGGAPGSNSICGSTTCDPAGTGATGGDSMITDSSSTVLAKAGGGAGGSGGVYGACGYGGFGGTGTNGPNSIGLAGGMGQSCNNGSYVPGAGGIPSAGSIPPPGGTGGPGQSVGSDGYVLITY